MNKSERLTIRLSDEQKLPSKPKPISSAFPQPTSSFKKWQTIPSMNLPNPKMSATIHSPPPSHQTPGPTCHTLVPPTCLPKNTQKPIKQRPDPNIVPRETLPTSLQNTPSTHLRTNLPPHR